MSGALVLAARLRAMDDAELRRAIEARDFPQTKINDFFDLAEALLDRRSIQAALAGLDRMTLAALAGTGGDDLQRPIELLLAHPGSPPTAYAAVTETLEAWPTLGLPDASALADAPPPAPKGHCVSEPAADQLASERAFRTVSAVTELISELTGQPAHELQKGGLALPDRKRLAAAMSLELEDVEAIASIAAAASLIVRRDDVWLPDERAGDWAMQPTPGRWAALAQAWLATVPGGIREMLVSRVLADLGDGLLDVIAWHYPAGGDRLRQQVAGLTRDARALGITSGRAPSTAGALLVENKETGAQAAADLLAVDFPHEVDKVYLQHDLTIVSPGTLSPAIDVQLRSMADVEVRAQASTYRISAPSVNRAIAAGASATDILGFLQQISLTGIPQPLEYLVSETAARYGLLRVAPVDTPSTKSIVHSSNTGLLGALEVDQLLASLGFRRLDAHRLATRFERDIVFWSLHNARYPVAAEDASGATVNLRRHEVPRVSAPSRADAAGELIERLRESQSEDPAGVDGAWLQRQLEIAIRSRSTLLVRVDLPGGTVAEYLLEPTGIGGGRLRGRDRNSDIERTLPLSHIRSAEPVAQQAVD